MVPNTSGTKGRLLFLQSFLMDHTDDNNVITTEELLQLYAKNGYKANRSTVRDDIAVLCSFGTDVIVDRVTRNGTKTNAYHIGDRLFELPEVKLLIDAVSSSRFITRSKSDLMIRKLLKLSNEQNRKVLMARVPVTEHLKSSNPAVMVITDTVCQAIANHRKISFHYWDYSPEKEKILRHDGEEYILSPYALIWNDDRYYVAGYSDKRQKVVKFRVDRMCDVRESEDEAAVDNTFDLSDYARKAIKLFDDDKEECQVTLLCKNERMKNVVDRFGEDIPAEIADDQMFRTTITVCPSSTFFGWVVQYKGEILIETPEGVKKDYEEMLSKILRKQRRQKQSGDRSQESKEQPDADHKIGQRCGMDWTSNGEHGILK